MRHTARTLAELSALPSDERLRALERIIPLSTVQAVLRQTGHDKRHCRCLPHWFVAYFVLGLGLFAKDSYSQIFKNLQRFRPGGTPGRNTFTEARKGLGIAPMRLLSGQVVRLLGTPDRAGAFYKGMRSMSLDGFVIDLPDSPANDRVFGRPSSGRAAGAFPQARVLALCETGSHVIYRWQVKPLRRGEVGMTAVLLRHLEADMLLLWDRNFLCHKTVLMVKQRDASLLARVKSNYIFAATAVLPDGSYLSKIYPSSRQRERDKGGIVVRLIEYTLGDTGHAEGGKVHRLLTTLLDAEQHPAVELIMLYHERWEEELAIDEVKTHLRERPVLRSQSPAGVIQEIEGLLLAHFTVRALMQEAAESQGIDPDRLSFTATLKVLRCRLPEVPKGSTKAARKRWWDDLVAEVSEAVLPPRRRRINPRVIKRKMSNWKKKRAHHLKPQQPSKPFKDLIAVI